MFSLTNEFTANSVSVLHNNTNTIIRVCPDHTGTIHCTEITAINELSSRIIDMTTRQQFQQITPEPNTVNILEAPAGSGKTTLNIQTMQNYTAKTGRKSILLAYNTLAVIDATAKLNGTVNTIASTIDAMIFKLFKPNTEMTELSDLLSVSKIANSLLDRPVYEEEIEDLIDDLTYACDTGDISQLSDDALDLFNAGMRGQWWSYSILRLRALKHSAEWCQLFSEYGLIIVDEAQDISCTIMQLLKLLHPSHPMIYTLDTEQKIYSFLGCVNVANEIEEYRLWKLYITFRHGQSVCDYIYNNKISCRRVFAASNSTITTIDTVDDGVDVAEPHTLIVTSWRNCLTGADKLLNKGKKVCIDAQKHKDLLEMSGNSGWTRENGKLFKYMPKHFVNDIMKRLNTVPVSECDVYITTIHGSKGLEYNVVRISKCVMNKRKVSSGNNEIDDHLQKVYVALTRVKCKLYLPEMKRKR
jgi:hypothetical protein